MERLETKKINGHTYYYYSEWGWVNGKCRRKWQRYLGKLQDILKACESGGPAPLHAELFQWGLPSALWKELQRAQIVEEIDRLCPKRRQGLSTGEYLALAAVNRAMRPVSKRSFWDWFSGTVLLRHVPGASKEALSSQRFWDHMERIDPRRAREIWRKVIGGVVAREGIDLSSVSYDGTNFYTFIDTFNGRCRLPRRGKNKQGQNSLRQVSYALFCCADGQLPLFYEVYEGNRNDARQFPEMLEGFNGFLEQLGQGRCGPERTTVIFDKGNNSAANFRLLDETGLKFVGSVKLGEHKELAEISNRDERFRSCQDAGIDGTKALRVTKVAYGRPRVMVVSYNQNLFDAQWLTVQNDLDKAVQKLSELQRKLRDRAAGLITKGRAPSAASVQKQCQRHLSRPYLKEIVAVEIGESEDGVPRLEYRVDAEARSKIEDTCLGKTIIVTNRDDWDDARIIEAYRSQFIIENVFKEMKDRTHGNWWPLNHWTDSKIRVHGLYCTLALLLRALLWRRVRAARLPLSMKRLLSELDDIRQVVNIYPKKRRQKTHPRQAVLSKTNEIQDRLLDILELREERGTTLG